MQGSYGVRIVGCTAVLPPHTVSSREVIQRMKRVSSPALTIPDRMLELTTGIVSRRYVSEETNASDLAADAAHRLLHEIGRPADSIDLLLWASASQDISEPATAHVVQQKLGISAPAMDVKNACNSFINGLQVAEALIQSGQYRNALVVVGETPSQVIRWDLRRRSDLVQHAAAYTFGDAGAALLLERSQENSGIFYRRFQSYSEYWDIGGVFGGGSLHRRDPSQIYFRGDIARLRKAFHEVSADLLFQALEETGLTYDDFSRIFLHQVSMPLLDMFLAKTGMPREKIVLTLPDFGNVASATIPVGLARAIGTGEIRRGDNILLVGIAGGLSLGVLMATF